MEITNRLLRGFVGDSSATGAHPLDLLIAGASRGSKLFSRGWGEESLLTELSTRVSYSDPPSPISVEWQSTRKRGRVVRRDGTFASPLELLPKETRTVHVRAWLREGNRAACVILAASRDEGYQPREHVFGPLIARGLDLYFLVSPFYGRRRVPGRTVSHHRQRSRLHGAGDGAGGARAAGKSERPLFEAGCGRLQHGRPYGRDYRGGLVPSPSRVRALATGASASSIYTRGLLSWSVDLDSLGGGSNWRAAARERLQQLFERRRYHALSSADQGQTQPSLQDVRATGMCRAARPSVCISTGTEARYAGFRPAISPRW